jgi:thiaminase/transcriptional activator TenA
MSITSQLKTEHAELWRMAVEHPFINELGDGSLPAEKFRRYFLQDYVFVNDLVKMAGIAVSKAPGLELARPIEEFLHAILGAEDALFLDAFKTLEIPENDYRNVEPLPTTAAFGNFLVRLAYESSFTEICCAMFVTEGVYVDWGERLRKSGVKPATGKSGLGEFYQGWIDLHTEDVLGEIVRFLGGVVDNAAETELPRLRRVFERALRYEVAFWEMSYRGEQWP